MNRATLLRRGACAAALAVVLVLQSAAANGGRHGYRGHGHHGGHYRNSPSFAFGYRRGPGSAHYRGGGGHYRGGGGHYRGGGGRSGVRLGVSAHGGGDLAIGVVAGLITGYLIGHQRRPEPRYEAPRYEPPRYRLPPPVRSGRPAFRPAPPERLAAACLQTREFRTRVLIGNRTVDAYGTACLQPDGSWRQLGISPG